MVGANEGASQSRGPFFIPALFPAPARWPAEASAAAELVLWVQHLAVHAPWRPAEAGDAAEPVR